MPTDPSSPTHSNSYLLLFRNAGEESHRNLNAEQREELTRQWNSWLADLIGSGKLVDGRPLELGGRVVSGVGGKRITDGPFAEAKEVVGGFFMIAVADIEEATAIAQRCPGLPLGMTVEVRPIAVCSPVLEGVRAVRE